MNDKPMTFDEWVKTYNFIGFGTEDEEIRVAKAAWDACKEQVIKIVNSDDCHCDYDSGRIVDEVEKL